MNLNQLKKLVNLHRLIQLGHTGTSYQIALLLNTSRRSVMTYMSELRDLGAQIEYDSVRCTYYYSNNFDLQCCIRVSYDAAGREEHYDI